MVETAYELSDDRDRELGRLVGGAVDGNIVYLTRQGQRIAAVVPTSIAAAGVAAVEAYEDAEDARIGMEAHAEWEASGRTSYPLHEVLEELDSEEA